MSGGVLCRGFCRVEFVTESLLVSLNGGSFSVVSCVLRPLLSSLIVDLPDAQTFMQAAKQCAMFYAVMNHQSECLNQKQYCTSQ